MAKTVVGLYEDMTLAQKVVRELTSHGFRRDDISLVANDSAGELGRGLGEGKTGDASDGAATGAGVGAALGGVGGLLVGLGALAIPGIGPIIAAGPIAAALAGAGIGAVAGGIVGALVDLGIPEDEANLYNEGVRRGGILVMVNAPDNMANQASEIMSRFDPIDIEKRSSDWDNTSSDRYGESTTGRSASDTLRSTTQPAGTEQRRDMHRDMTDREGERTIPIVEEEMRVGKRQTQTGGVRVHTRMEEHPVEEQVNLRREHVEVERRPADRPATEADMNAFREGTFEVTETSEEAVVDKQARVTEDVVIDKDVEHTTETVRDSVRRTKVETEDLGTRGTKRTGDFDTFDPNFRRHYESSFASTGYDYNHFQPAYRYGYDLAGNERYVNREWRQVEQDARRDWMSNHPDSKWEEFKEAVREGWDSVRGRR